MSPVRCLLCLTEVGALDDMDQLVLNIDEHMDHCPALLMREALREAAEIQRRKDAARWN